MRRAAIVSPLRTPVGTFGGALRDVPVEDLAATVVRAVVAQPGIDPERLDDVVFAQSYANSEVPCVGRWAALHAGLPIEVPGMQLDRRCGGGLQALVMAAMMVQTGAADVVLAGGVESMSRIEYYSTATRWGARAGTVPLYDRLDRGRERSQPEDRADLRDDRDGREPRHRLRHRPLPGRRVRRAQPPAGRRGLERRPVHRRGGPGGGAAAPRRPGARRLRPGHPAGLHPRDPGPAPAGHARRHRHGRERRPAERRGGRLPGGRGRPAGRPRPGALGYLGGWAAAGCDPSRMGFGPVPAVAKLAARTGTDTRHLLDRMDLVELNEAFAVQVLAVLEGWGGYDEDRLNVNGSGISLGHPIGATGMRMVTTLLHELRRRGGGQGLVTMCVGGGQGLAATVEAA